MQFLGEIIIAILSSYLALTNTVADGIESMFVQDAPPSEATSLSKLSSAYDSIPRILIENASYQNAAVADGVVTPYAESPVDALVNIFCTYSTEEYTRSTTGTGFFIHQDGIILTNAHVAQFLLLESTGGSATCVVRTGSPAEPMYEADLLYISPAWIQENAHLITDHNPSGTGERDYALLYVTAGLDNKPMPRHFPALSFTRELLNVNIVDTAVTAAGYPAEKLLAEAGATAELIPKQADTTIVELMTFGSNYADLMTIAGSAIGEQGSSGGPVVDQSGAVIGIISTKGDDAAFGQGSLRALTMSYIDRTIEEETGFPLTRNLSGNLPFRSKLFKETMIPFLQNMLADELE